MPHRILVVDDEAHILQVLSLKLRNAGYEVITAVDGEEALEYALRRSPDLVMTDFQMPYMTGLELCKALAANAATAGIPVLMLTARGHALDAEDLALGNIKDVLSKPFSPRAVVEQIQKLLGQGQVSREQVSRCQGDEVSRDARALDTFTPHTLTPLPDTLTTHTMTPLPDASKPPSREAA